MKNCNTAAECALLKQENEILRGQCVLVTKDTLKYKKQLLDWLVENERLKDENKKLREQLADKYRNDY